MAKWREEEQAGKPGAGREERGDRQQVTLESTLLHCLLMCTARAPARASLSGAPPVVLRGVFDARLAAINHNRVSVWGSHGGAVRHIT
eukprot:69252-Rhodomonas_salina.2